MQYGTFVRLHIGRTHRVGRVSIDVDQIGQLFDVAVLHLATFLFIEALVSIQKRRMRKEINNNNKD